MRSSGLVTLGALAALAQTLAPPGARAEEPVAPGRSRGAHIVLDTAPPPAAPAALPEDAALDGARTRRTVGWLLLGLGGTTLIASAVTGGLALAAESDLEALCPRDECPEGFERRRDEGARLAVTADVLLGATAGLAAIGSALLLWGAEPDVARPREGTLALEVGADGRGACHAWLRGRW